MPVGAPAIAAPTYCRLEEDVVSAVWDILCNEYVSPITLVKEHIAGIVSKIASFRDYGPPLLRQGVLIWELNDPSIIQDPALSSSIQHDQILRKAVPSFPIVQACASSNLL